MASNARNRSQYCKWGDRARASESPVHTVSNKISCRFFPEGKDRKAGSARTHIPGWYSGSRAAHFTSVQSDDSPTKCALNVQLTRTYCWTSFRLISQQAKGTNGSKPPPTMAARPAGPICRRAARHSNTTPSAAAKNRAFCRNKKEIPRQTPAAPQAHAVGRPVRG